MTIRAIIAAAVLSTAGLAVASANAATPAPASAPAAKTATAPAAKPVKTTRAAKHHAKPAVHKTSAHKKAKGMRRAKAA